MLGLAVFPIVMQRCNNWLTSPHYLYTHKQGGPAADVFGAGYMMRRTIKYHPKRFPSMRYLNALAMALVLAVWSGGASAQRIKVDGTTDLAMASRRIKFSEKMKMKQSGHTPVEVVVAYDALAVIVHPSNPVKRLTREQLEAIFRGKITNWKEVGGPDARIVVYSRETSSGTYEFFKESVLHNKNYMAGVLSMPATGAIIQSVSQTRGAIGYVGLAYLNPRVKALAVSYDGGRHYVEPSVKAAMARQYPVVRPLYYYYDQANAAKVRPFLQYIASQAARAKTLELGFIPR